jgi:hypothetical protein
MEQASEVVGVLSTKEMLLNQATERAATADSAVFKSY